MADKEGIYLEYRIDTGKLDAGVKEAEGKLKKLGDFVETEGSRIDKAYNRAFAIDTTSIREINANISNQKQALKDLQTEYKNTEKAMKQIAPGQEQYAMRRTLAGIKQEIDEEKAALNGLMAKQEELKLNYVSVISQIRAVRNEMLNLKIAGKQESDRYKELEVELKNLSTAYREIQTEQKMLYGGSAQIQGLVSGMQGLMGAYTVGSGIVGAFTKDQEKLQQVQTRMQSTMAILMGMQQVMNTLHSTSAFKLGIVNKVRNAYRASIEASRAALKGATTAEITNTAATGGQAAAATKGTVANIGLAASFRAVGAAIKAIPVLGWIVAGISALIGVVSIFTSKAREARKAAEEFNKSVAENTAKPIGEIKRLQYEWNQLGNDLQAKEKFIKDNKKAFEELGWAVKDVAEAEKVLSSSENVQAFINAQIAKAKSLIILDSKAYKNQLKNLIDAESALKEETEKFEKLTNEKASFDENGNVIEGSYKMQKLIWKIRETNEELENIHQQSLDYQKEYWTEFNALGLEGAKEYAAGTVGAIEQAIKEKQEALEGLKGDNEAYRKTLDEIAELQKQLDAITGKKDKSTESDIENARKKYHDAALDAQKKFYSEETALLRKQIEDKVELIEFDRDRTIEAIEAERDAFLELAKAAGVSLPENALDYFTNRISMAGKSAQIDIDKERKRKEEEYEKELDDLLKQFQTFEEKRLSIVKEYEAKIKLLRDKGYEDQAQEAEKQRNSKLAAIDIEDMTMPLVEAFGEIDRLTNESLDSLIQKIEEFIETSGNSLDITSLKSLTETLIELKNEVISRNPFTSLSNSIKEYNAATKDLKNAQKQNLSGEEIERFRQRQRNAMIDVEKSVIAVSDNFKMLGSEFTNLSNALGDIDEGIGAIFSSVGNCITTIGEMGNAIANVSRITSESINAVEKASIILSVISAAVKMANTIKNLFSNKAQKEEARKWEQESLAFQREYNMLLMERNYLEKEYSDIFGESSISRAAAAYKSAQEALQMYNDELKNAETSFNPFDIFSNPNKFNTTLKAIENGYSTLQASLVKTKSRSGLAKAFGAKDKYSTLFDIAPELWGNKLDGVFDTEAAKKFLETNTKISDEIRTEIENVIKLKDTYDDAMNVIDKQLNSWLGSMASNMADSIWDSVVNGGADAWGRWQDIGADAIASIGKQMLSELIMDSYLNSFTEDLRKAYKTDDPAKEVANITSEIIDGFPKIFDVATNAAKDFITSMEVKGVDFSSGSQSRTASQKGIASISQESANIIDGRLTVMQGHTYSINEQTKILAANSVAVLAQVTAIRGNTDRLERIERDMGSMKSSLGNIETRGISIKT